MGYVWLQRIRLALVVVSPILFAWQLAGAFADPHGLGWILSAVWAALGIYFAYDYRKAKAAHAARPQTPVGRRRG